MVSHSFVNQYVHRQSFRVYWSLAGRKVFLPPLVEAARMRIDLTKTRADPGLWGRDGICIIRLVHPATYLIVVDMPLGMSLNYTGSNTLVETSLHLVL